MSFFKWVITLVNLIFTKVKNAVILAGYNERTIYKHFRKQGAKVGDHCRIQTRSLGSEPYLIEIGNHVCVSAGVIFHTHDGGTWVFREEVPEVSAFGKIIIEDNCLIGRNVQLLPNIRIGKNSIIGANSVVISDVPPFSIFMGVPARPFGSILKYKEKCFNTWKIQEPLDLDKTQKQWPSKKNQKILKRHLIELFMNMSKTRDE